MGNQPAKRGRGRPPTRYTLPPPIDATAEEIAETVLQIKPPKEWKYLKMPRETKN